MYLTKIKHDFTFHVNHTMDEVLYDLEFKQIKIKPIYFIPRSKISFFANQGRKVDLFFHNTFFSRAKQYTLKIENIIEFTWKQKLRIIKYRYLKDFNNRLVHYWLLHTFLPLYYTIENMYDMLHVGAIEINRKACLFTAPSFGGKSTLTHYFLQKGHALFSDDKLALTKRENIYHAVPSYPYARNYRKLEDLGVYRENFSKRSLPIGCIYRLKQVKSDEDIAIQEVKGIEKFSIIEMSSDINLSVLKEKRFSVLQDLTQNLRVYEITVPQNLDRLDEVYEKIIEHFQPLVNEDKYAI